MTAFARLLLLLTSLAPILVIYAAVLAEREQCEAGGALIATATALVVLCWALLTGEKRISSPVPRRISNISTKETEPISFLVAYALPLVAIKTGADTNMLAVGVFTIVMALVIWQQQVFHVNPLLVLLGYHFYSARNDSDAEILILTKRKTLAPGESLFVELSDYFWLEVLTSNSRKREVSDDNTPVRNSKVT